MKLKVFSVRDEAVGAFLPPFFVRSPGEAIRSFMDAAQDPSRFGRHASDFVLYSIGEYDDVSASMVTTEPVRIMSALESQVHAAGDEAVPAGTANGGATAFSRASTL